MNTSTVLRAGRIRRTFVLTMVAAVFAPAWADASIIGFNNLSGWTYNTADSGSPPVIVNSDSIQLTTGHDQRRSLWFNTSQDISQPFTASFTYRASSISASASRQGITFAIQNSPAGLSALGTSGSSNYGYANIANSAAVTIETDTGPGATYTGFYTNGVLGGGSANMGPVNAFNFTDINVNIAYNGSVLSVTMSQGANVFGPSNYFVGSLASTIGSPNAYIGFTASTANTLGSGGGANQFISNARFVPEPASALLMIGAIAVAARRRRSAE